MRPFGPPPPALVPLYGTLHGVAYDHYNDRTTTGLPLLGAVREAGLRPQMPMRSLEYGPEDLQVMLPSLTAELEEKHRSLVASGVPANLLCRCDGNSRWVSVAVAGEDHECVNTVEVGGGFELLGGRPAQHGFGRPWTPAWNSDAPFVQPESAENGSDKPSSTATEQDMGTSLHLQPNSPRNAPCPRET